MINTWKNRILDESSDWENDETRDTIDNESDFADVIGEFQDKFDYDPNSSEWLEYYFKDKKESEEALDWLEKRGVTCKLYPLEDYEKEAELYGDVSVIFIWE